MTCFFLTCASGQAFVAKKAQCADVGSSASLTCNATNVPRQNITWIRKGNTVVSGAQHSVDNVDGSSKLTIKNVTTHDHGYYVCDAAVNADHQNSASGYLQVPCQGLRLFIILIYANVCVHVY